MLGKHAKLIISACGIVRIKDTDGLIARVFAAGVLIVSFDKRRIRCLKIITIT